MVDENLQKNLANPVDNKIQTKTLQYKDNLTDEALANLDIEKSLLGFVLLNNNVFEDVGEIVKKENFYAQIHQQIYEIISVLLGKSQVADIVTVSQFASLNPKYKDINFEYLLNLTNSIINTAKFKDYANIIYDLYLKRQLLILQNNISSHLTTSNDFTKIIETIEEEIFKLNQQGSIESKVSTFEDAVLRSLKNVELARKFKDGISGLDTGLRELNRKLGGLQKSDLIVLAGRPSMGKTALATNIAVNCAMKYMQTKEHPGAPVVIFSLEMSSDQIAGRILSSYSGISSDSLRKGQLTDEQFNTLVKAVQQFKNTPIFIDDTPALTISQIRNRCRRLKRQHNIGLVVIDYIQLIGNDKKSDSRTTEVGEITRGLKSIAKELGVPIIALSQLSRAVEAREDKTPMLSDLRESGSIEQDADIVSFIFREEYYVEREEPKFANKDESQDKFRERLEKWRARLEMVRNKATLVIAKNRHGSVGNIDLVFNPQNTHFYDVDKTHNIKP
jgi:replicative DNA helicase